MNNIELMLRALLSKENQLCWVHGWVGGRTAKNGDPYIILFNQHLKKKICKVYDQSFGKLPFPLPNAIPADNRGETTITREEAQQQGVYHEFPAAFEIVISFGKDTPLGRERRFGGVLRVAKVKAAETAVPKRITPVQRVPVIEPVKPRKAAVRRKPQPPAAKLATPEFLQIAANCKTAADFDTMIVLAEPWFGKAETVKEFRAFLYPNWKASEAKKAATILMNYAKHRQSNIEHPEAKQRAIASTG